MDHDRDRTAATPDEAAANPLATLVIRTGGRPVVVGYVSPHHRCDIDLVDALSRFVLASRRLGWTVELRGVQPRLADLFRLAGLGSLLQHRPVR
jgi:hypothetical protein